MPPEDHVGIHCSIGVSGSGKTHGLKRDTYAAVAAGMPTIAIDVAYEWSEIPQELADVASGTTNVAEAVNRMRSGQRFVVVRPPGDPTQAAVDALRWAMAHPGPAGVAIPEAHNIAPQSAKLEPDVFVAATRWRHFKLGLFLDAQRYASISKAVIDNCYDLKVYAQVGRADFKALMDLGDRSLVEAVREAARRLEQNDPGWHVQLTISRLPPYVLRKEE